MGRAAPWAECVDPTGVNEAAVAVARRRTAQAGGGEGE